jgi:hypothetical protein
MEYIQNKIKEFALQIAFVLILLQFVVGTFVDMWLGGMVLGILYLTLKVKG